MCGELNSAHLCVFVFKMYENNGKTKWATMMRLYQESKMAVSSTLCLGLLFPLWTGSVGSTCIKNFSFVGFLDSEFIHIC